jgi:indole-3-glycerol phosphate synthase
MSILDTIVARKRVEVAALPPGPAAPDAIRAAITENGGGRDFAHALRHPPGGGPALIAEIKKASPSAGVICPDFDPVRIACQYERSGAACLSVLTDTPFFQGSLADLQAVRHAVGIPLLRKDFIIDERQVLEAARWGADAILLIAAILADEPLKRLHDLARAGGLAVLVEVHDEPELDRAVAVGADLIGVNNRDLRTFRVDLGTTERLAARLRRYPPAQGRLLVAESGIRTGADVRRLADAGAGAILVGEALMREADLAARIAELTACASR